jgi:Lon protease-like protein
MSRVEQRRMDHGIVRWFVTDRGVQYTHYECERRLKSAVNAVERWFGRAVRTRTTWDEAEMNEHEIQGLRRELRDLQSYVEAAQRQLDDIEGVDRRTERIKALREVAGRTPAEAAAFLRKADQLEGKAHERRA